jgi:plasmid stabilization system protein ParE
MSRLIFAPEADDDLMEIARYIAKRNLPAAERFIDSA